MPGRGMNLLKERIRMENMLDFPMMHVCLRLPTERDVGGTVLTHRNYINRIMLLAYEEKMFGTGLKE